MARRDPMNDANPLDKLTREQWASTVAAVLSFLPLQAIDAIVAGGEAVWLKTASPILQGHAFKKEDFRHIYKVLVEVSRTRQAPSPKDILGSLAQN